MRNIKKFSDFLVEQTGRFGQPSTPKKEAPPANNKQPVATTAGAATAGAATAQITQEKFNTIVAELDGFALYFANKAQTLVKYDKTSMSDCDGTFNDDEDCYWKIIWQNWEMQGCPAAYTKFAAKVTEYAGVENVNIAKYPDPDAAKLVQTRVAHNLHEANRMNQKDFNKLTVENGKRTDTLRGMVMKMINLSDHNFRWTMYYTNTSVTPHGGGNPTPVSPTSTYKVDCDF